jgi:hypothetical protein
VSRRLLGAALAVVVLVLVWRRAGWATLGETLAQLDGWWLAAAFFMFVPQTLGAAVRWTWLVGAYQPMGLARATAMVLAGQALSIVLPMKLGDVAKGAFLRRDLPGGDARTGLALGVFEKLGDVAALATLMVAASLLAPPAERLGWIALAAGAAGLAGFGALLVTPVDGWIADRVERVRPAPLGRALHVLVTASGVVRALRRRPRRLALVLAAGLALWALHLGQFSLIHRAAGGAATEPLLWSRMAMAIFIGLVPVTFVGIGTRDAAVLYFLGAAAGDGVAVVLGAFATFRYVVGAVAGLPFLARLPLGEPTAGRGWAARSMAGRR